MTALTSLNLAGCVSIGEQGMALLPAHMPLLECLRLGGCSRVATITDPCLAPLQHLKALTHLDLAGCLEITDAGMCVCSDVNQSMGGTPAQGVGVVEGGWLVGGRGGGGGTE